MVHWPCVSWKPTRHKMKNKNRFVLLVIVIIGFVLRFYRLSDFPPSLNWDEISHGYNAYSILKTGADEWGVRFPLIFRAFGDYKLPAYIYLTTLPVLAFGLNAFAVRFISALAGVLAIPLIYLLTNKLFSPVSSRVCSRDLEDSSTTVGMTSAGHKITAGHIAAFLLALSPWHFFFSRAALEANLSLALIIAGAYFLLSGPLNTKYYLLATFFLSLSLHAYNAARVFVPLLIVAFALIYRRRIKFGPSLLFGAIILILSLSLVAYQFKTGEATARYAKLAIINSATTFQIGQDRLASGLPTLVSRLIYNRPVFFTKKFTLNYFSYFTPTFFNQTRDVQTQFAIPNQNLFTYPVYLLAIIGFFIQLTRIKNESSAKFILAWLLIAPIAAAATIDPPQAIRPSLLMIPVILLAVSALIWLSKRFGSVVIWLSIILTGVFFAQYLYQYFYIYPVKYSPSWQYGYEQVIKYVLDHKNEYDRIFITKKYGEPHIFYSFFSKLDPKIIQFPTSSTRFTQADWFWTDRIENVYFVNDWLISTTDALNLKLESGEQVSTKRSLLVTSFDNIPTNTSRIKTINFLDGSPAFVIVKF